MSNNLTSVISSYKIEQDENGGVLLDDRSQIMKTHLGTLYPPLPLEQANIILEDINEIISEKAYIGQGKKRKSLLPHEVLQHPKAAEIRKQQERMSFAVCVQNTLIEMDQIQDFDLPMAQLLQWDMLYRMSPDPHAKMDQMAASEQAINWLGKDWKDLPANYCQNLDDMKEQDVPFVAESLVARLQNLMTGLIPAEKVAVWFLYEFFQRYSISIPLLWVKGFVDGACLEDSYYALASDFSSEEIMKMKKEEGDFVQRRLGYLKAYLLAKKAAD